MERQRHMQFEAEVRNVGNMAIIDLGGEINGLAEDALNQAYAKAEGYDPKLILLNFKDVVYINSTGIALLVDLLTRTRQTHRHLIACGFSDHYITIFNITRLSDYMRIYPDESSVFQDLPNLARMDWNQEEKDDDPHDDGRAQGST